MSNKIVYICFLFAYPENNFQKIVCQFVGYGHQIPFPLFTQISCNIEQCIFFVNVYESIGKLI